MLNKVILIGRIASPPEKSVTTTGKSRVSFRIAVNRKVKSGADGITADFFSVTAWGKSADFVAEYLHKGSLIAIDGRIETRKYTARDGQKREAFDIIAEDVRSLGKNSDSGETDPVADEPSAAAQAPTGEYDPFADE